MAPKRADEVAFVAKLRALGAECNAFDGLTTIEQRKDSILTAMDTFQDVTYTIQNGKRITMAMRYAAIYGETP